MDSFYYIFLFLIGACFGSFSNLIVYRLPRGLNIAKPSSHCIKCQQKIPWYNNIPIISVLFLRARCKNCNVFFGWDTLLIETSMAFLFVAVYKLYGFSFTAFELYIFIFGLITISFIDLEFRIIPDVFSLSGIVIGLMGAVLSPDRSFLPALFGMLIGGGIFWFMAWLYWVLRKEEGMGGGDIKLLAWIGAVLGWQSITFVILVSSVLGSIIGILTAIRSKEGMKSSIPFGPFLALAAVFYIFGGEKISLWYMRLFMPWMQ